MNSPDRSAKPPRRHHFVPRFYLARFADQKGRLSAYDRTMGKTFTAKPEQLAVETDFYRLPDETKLSPTFLEEILSIQEGSAATTIREVVAAGSIDPKHQSELALHLALQQLRTRHTRDVLGEMSEWSGTLHLQVEIRKRLESGEFVTEQQREMAEQALKELADGSLTVRPQDQALTGLALRSLEQFAAHLLDNWNWIMVVLPLPRFVTSDQPIAMLGEPEPGSPAINVGVATALEIWFPLDARHALVLSRDHSLPSPLVDLADSHVRMINLRLALESHRWVFFRPGTEPLKGLQIPTQSPQWFAKTMGTRDRGDGTIGELVITGVSRPTVPHERLLSGRELLPFPQLTRSTAAQSLSSIYSRRPGTDVEREN